MGYSKQIVHLREATLKVRPVCRPMVRSVGKWREVRPCSEELLKEIEFPQKPSLVLIPIIISKLT